MAKFFIVVCLFLYGNLIVFPQQSILPIAIEEIIEEIAAASEEDIDLSVIIDDLSSLWENPLDLNQATHEDLSRLYLLNDFQINNLLDYVKRFGPVLSIYELGYIEGLTTEVVTKISPFLTIGTRLPGIKLSAKNIIRYGKHQVYLRTQQVLEQQKGFSPITDSALAASPNSRYLGSPLKIYNRYQFNFRNQVYWGITSEKDTGEEFFKGSNKYGYDYYSAHLFIRDAGKLKKIAAGDFHVRFGQGLVLWPGFSQGKSAYVLNIKKNPRGLVKYSSTDENLFMRGIGTTVGISKRVDLTVFFSYKKIDASVSSLDSLTNELEEVTTIQTTGLHATPSQVLNKNSLGESIAGTNFTWKGKTYKIGLTGVYYKYSASVMPDERLYNQFEFSGKENLNIGLDYQASYKNLQFFGEAAVSQSGGKALLTGLLANAGPRVSFAALYRNYSRNYQTYFGNAFGENSKNMNETGFYTGIVILPLPKWKLSAFFDVFNFPWLRYGVYTPSAGSDYLVQADFNPSRSVSMYFRVKQKNKPLNALVQEPYIRQTEDVSNTNFRYQIGYKVLPSIELRNRIEFITYKKESLSAEKGFLLYQDIIYRSATIPLTVSLRYAIFDTDSYNTRIYAYENDVLYAFSIPAYYEQGFRSYLNLSYSFKGGLDLWFRIAQTQLPKRTIISSGLNEISGNTRTEIKLQARYTF